MDNVNIKPQRVLFVDDEPMLHDVFRRLLTREGIEVTTYSSALQAIEHLNDDDAYDLCVTDFKMPKMDGLELLAHIREEHPHIKVVMITAHGSVQHAVSAMKGGVVDYIPKPFSTDELVLRLKAQLESAERPEEVSPSLNGSPSVKATTRPKKKATFVGEHKSIQRIKKLLPKVANNRAPVFVHGESGTGKEIFARLVHQMSPRTDKPYITINCANLPRELVESHLFGHKKGAFTGAVSDMTGAFERANGGTLLLDEITEIALPVQAKLLRVLQEQEFHKLGANGPTQVDVRVIATSNRDLNEAVQEKVFREDLYHRLAVFPLYIPPLRGRISDIPLLAEHFVQKYCDLYNFPPKMISPELMCRFQGHPWPGNVRELENMIHRGVVLTADEDSVQVDDVVNDFFTDTQSSRRKAPQVLADGGATTIEEMERRMIIQALTRVENNQRMAAEELGISARTIRNKLNKYRAEGYAV